MYFYGAMPFFKSGLNRNVFSVVSQGSNFQQANPFYGFIVGFGVNNQIMHNNTGIFPILYSQNASIFHAPQPQMQVSTTILLEKQRILDQRVATEKKISQVVEKWGQMSDSTYNSMKMLSEAGRKGFPLPNQVFLQYPEMKTLTRINEQEYQNFFDGVELERRYVKNGNKYPMLNNVPKHSTETVYYGDSDSSYFDLKIPRSAKKGKNKDVKLAVLVHGGGFIGGSARSENQEVLEAYFLKKGYVVANIEYPLLEKTKDGGDVKWPEPVEAIADGVNTVFETLEDKGYNVVDSTYVGSSAGAIAGGLLFYNDAYPSIHEMDRFISMDGAYNLEGIPPRHALNLKKNYGVDVKSMFPEDQYLSKKKSSTSALLIEGSKDEMDLYAGTSQSHAETLSSILDDNGVQNETYTLSKAGFRGHDGGISLGYEDEDLIRTLDNFLKV